MISNPLLGVCFHWLGGLASGSFYVPYKGVRHWAWETYWLVGGVFSWIICPWTLAFFLTKDLSGVIGSQSVSTLWWTYFFGALWGLGGLTFGLTMRYLGMSLGMGVALGFCASFGTLLPPFFKSFVPSIPVPETLRQIASTQAGVVTLAGVGVCLLGIAVAVLAGLCKEREMPDVEKKKAIGEFNFRKGMLVAVFSGVMSACFAFALTAGAPIAEASQRAGTPVLWTGLPKLVVVLLGGFSSNCVWCVYLNYKNKTGGQYLRPVGVDSLDPTRTVRVPLLANYGFSALAGLTWYMQFFFYTMGETQMGRFGFASWTLHMASIIIFSTLWGWGLKEWKGASRRTHGLIAGGLAVLVLSTLVIGWGTYLKGRAGSG